ncbi:MAG: valine--tRNA ligase [Candidatus Lloydbacteria bacterium RIFOXYC12_FULL_46_25]|uniref:Valine--tRNA ligase n=1 Tax=Candidatus Lloydbacteria bacterium RIFOXYC12_FULL_46_25 TaxID=1798670 RepID=A0A1G2DU82_9BACT|nr:MAG: valine--tRNA ligase [Candidatus Lloydbacteria bacterium RIFOXYC12_FULL_46_25]
MMLFMKDKFLKSYSPNETEQSIYELWEKSGYFNPDNLPGEQKESFTIVLPPPNVTGVLHLGHAYEDSLQDAVIRYQRMRGKRALWIPGTDSAAIATQARVEKNIQKDEGKSRHDLGREELVRRVSEFAKNSEDTILNQVRRMGASLDWSRYAYTLDEKRNLAVSTAFKRMYDAGLIYRGNRIVNWDPKGQTTISDDEIIHEERTAKLYTFKYSKEFPIAISTTRPETKVGDTAVAVHPSDERYKDYIGKEFDVVFCDVPLHIKIVGDDSVEKEFGTGALGVTPAHSQIDWDIADRHGLERPRVINEYAKMTVEGRLKDKKVLEAREGVVVWLQEQDLLEQEEEITQNVSTSERTGATIEPLPKLQWWVDVNKAFTIPHSEIPGIASGTQTSLKEIMRKSVESGAVDMPQERFKKTYFHWIDNLRDWCISRQIWFGHRIPVWYKGDEIYCDVIAPEGDGWKQEEDVLDTWFSSALWTFSTLGWPEKTKDLETFHPTSFMSPAYEILPLWVSRMILMSGFHLGQVPFKTVMIHGLVRDKHSRKFSKSLGNGINPIEIIDKYGADALRMGLLVGTAIGNDIKFDESKIKGYKHFANKLWNITRFILENTEGVDFSQSVIATQKDQELIKNLEALVAEITDDFDNHRLYLAAEKIYHYIWHEVADKILEESKTILDGSEDDNKLSRQRTLHTLLTTSLKLLHPFMPFVTEEIWQSLPEKEKDMLIIATWPS